MKRFAVVETGTGVQYLEDPVKKVSSASRPTSWCFGIIHNIADTEEVFDEKLCCCRL